MRSRTNYSRLHLMAVIAGLCLGILSPHVNSNEQSECVMPIDPTIGGQLLTRSEKIDLLNERFYDALAKFEACINASGGSATASGQNGATVGQIFGASNESVAVPNIQGTNLPESAENSQVSVTAPQSDDPFKSASGSEPIPNGQLPEELVVKDNDAILLEQIRQAAIAEQDPDRKVELWQEYLKRKSGDGGSGS